MKKIISQITLIIMTFPLFAQSNFSKYNGTGGPVLEKSTDTTKWDYNAVADAEVILFQDTFRLWYTSGNFFIPDSKISIGYAWSLDGIQWNKWLTPVLEGTDGTWDSLALETVSVIVDTLAPLSERYRLWYVGTSDTTTLLSSPYWDIGYATSPNGINWTKQSNPVLSTTPFSATIDGYSLEGPTVIKDGDTLRMYYAGFSNMNNGQPWDGKLNLIYAWSLDIGSSGGITWNKKTDEPVLEAGNTAWDFDFVQDPKVLKIGNVYHIWYGGSNNSGANINIGHATSNDGLNWTKDPANPILSKGVSGSWDDKTCSFPSVVYKNNVYYMWYTGIDTNMGVSIPYYWDTGLAFDSSNVTGIFPNENRKNDLTIYPNPSSGKVNLISSESTINSILVYNSLGQLVSKSKPQKKIVQIDTDGFPTGIYLIKLEMGDNSLAKTELLIIN